MNPVGVTKKGKSRPYWSGFLFSDEPNKLACDCECEDKNGYRRWVTFLSEFGAHQDHENNPVGVTKKRSLCKCAVFCFLKAWALVHAVIGAEALATTYHKQRIPVQ